MNKVKEAAGNVYEVETKLLKDKNIELKRLPQLPNKTLINARHSNVLI